MNKYITEGIGAFFLTLTIQLAAGPLAPLAVGAMYMAMVYACSPVSGAHFNPALSFGIFLRGKMERNDLPYYIAVQVFGAVLATLMGSYLLSCGGPYAVTARTNEPLCALLAEFFGVFALVFVILNVSTSRTAAENPFYGLASGIVLTALIVMLAPYSGGVFNPAVAIAQTVSGHLHFSDIWIYLVGELLGAAAASTIFTITRGES